jgi:ribosomal protein L32
MLQSMSESAGDTSDEAWEFDRRTKEALGVKGLPGLGVSEEDDESIEHRVCPKCGNFDVRVRAI